MQDVNDDRSALLVPAEKQAARLNDRSLVDMMEEARQRLENMELSCRGMLDHTSDDTTATSTPSCASSQKELELLQIQVQQLKMQLVDTLHRREACDMIFERAMTYAAAKGTANAVLHTLFDQASGGKYQVLESYYETSVIPTRDGLKHWRLDLREIRNETGATILHVAVDASIARQNLKVKLVELLLDRMGFNVNVRDAFGRTPLHLATMAGFAEVTQALLARGADVSLRDHAGLTPLSVVRTLSRPPEEIVQLLTYAESAMVKKVPVSNGVSPQRAIGSALFLRTLGRFVRPLHASAFAKQTTALLEALLLHGNGPDTNRTTVDLNAALQAHVPLLFDVQPSPQSPTSTWHLVPFHSLFLRNRIHSDVAFVDELKIQAASYGFSLVAASTTTTGGAATGATWEGFLMKMIAVLKVEMTTAVAAASSTGVATATMDTTAASTNHSLSSTSSSSPLAVGPIVGLAGLPTQPRQAWHYAVLMKAATQPFPATLRVIKGDTSVTCSGDVARFFPCDDRLLIGSSEYHAVAYDPATQVIQLDRGYEGPNADKIQVYLSAGSSISSRFPPYITTKRIWEREPGNKYEDHMSQEQELFQDYQFLDPDSEYEVAVKLGPVPTAREARRLAEDWKMQARKLFDEKKCTSGLAGCVYFCPQRTGHSLCVETMAAIGRDLAKERLGRATFAKALKPRASLQKYQELFLAKGPWPGSPSSTLPGGVETGSSSASAAVALEGDLT